MKIDLHSHTRFSDGKLSPEALVLRAHTMQVDVLAITDHDTVDGLEEAHQTQSRLNRALTIIDGVELSTRWHAFDIHIVGVNIDRRAPVLQHALSSQAAIRRERAVKIGEKLAKCGFDGAFDKAQALAGVGQITRAHFARVLVDHYQVGSPANAFNQYLGKGKRAEVKAKWMSIEQAVEVIHQSGGQAVLAHPAHYPMTTKWLKRLVDTFSQANGDAIETAFPGLSKDKQEMINALTAEHQLLASAGSDFHFPSKWTELGRKLNIHPSLTPLWHDWPCTQCS